MIRIAGLYALPGEVRANAILSVSFGLLPGLFKDEFGNVSVQVVVLECATKKMLDFQKPFAPYSVSVQVSRSTVKICSPTLGGHSGRIGVRCT